MVSDVTIGSAIQQQSNTAGASTKLAEDFSQFLTLLTVQLQNQDPLSPMDTTEFTNQLVAFTGVEQQINTNQKLDSLVSLGLGNSVGQSLGYVGLDATYISSEFYHEDNGSDTNIQYTINGQAVEAAIRVFDESGDIIYEESANTNVGNHSFSWDGTTASGEIAETGTYQVRIDALDADDNALPATTVVNGRVRGVENQNGLIFLLIGERAVSQGNILSVSEPKQTQTESTDETSSDSEDNSTET